MPKGKPCSSTWDVRGHDKTSFYLSQAPPLLKSSLLGLALLQITIMYSSTEIYLQAASQKDKPTQIPGDNCIYCKAVYPAAWQPFLFLFSDWWVCPLIMSCLHGWRGHFKSLENAHLVPALSLARTCTATALNDSGQTIQLTVLSNHHPALSADRLFWWNSSSDETIFAPTYSHIDLWWQWERSSHWQYQPVW